MKLIGQSVKVFKHFNVTLTAILKQQQQQKTLQSLWIHNLIQLVSC